MATIVVTVTASPTSFFSGLDLLRLPSGDSISTSVCPRFVNPGSCPVKCFIPDPVCGIDNVTYCCGCSEALCTGVPVMKLGFCDVENGASGPVSGFRVAMLTAKKSFNSCFAYYQSEFQDTWFAQESSQMHNENQLVGDWYFGINVSKKVDCPFHATPPVIISLEQCKV